MATALDTHYNLFLFLFLTWLFSTLLVRYLIKKHLKPNTETAQHPPSPPALPIIGHLHLLSSVLPKCFQTLAFLYGPLMRIFVGSSTSLVVSNAAVALDVLKTHDLKFSYRPEFGAEDYTIYPNSDFFGADYGAYWRFIKRICMTQLLSAPQLNRFTDIRTEEIMKLLKVVLKCSEGNEACDMSAALMSTTNNVIFRMTMSTLFSGSSDDSKKIKKFTDGIVKAAAKLSLGEMKAALLQYDELVERILIEHEENRHKGVKWRKDMMDILLEICEDDTAEVKLTRSNIKALLLNIFIAGTETTGVALQWTLAEIINHPDIFNKLREEINTVIGCQRLIEESDVPNLHYLHAVVKEGLRLHPPSPLILRKNKDDCKVSGYDVLANSRMIVNAYAVMRDPDSWEEPSEFKPERFLASAREKHGLQFVAFGSGRRACPGATLALTLMPVIIGSLVQCFDYGRRVGRLCRHGSPTAVLSRYTL
ncbi:hypothetical protein RJ639_032816 [Escallonia herrerae]|uniref:Cytochrome P450 n=1 Tax=Escallonia herrerae TaxID=1293975 RepID=A0AA89BC65_9ASTE|nr:hypothetical protein RJ639_032816 [Escallonia herrerae]